MHYNGDDACSENISCHHCYSSHVVLKALQNEYGGQEFCNEILEKYWHFLKPSVNKTLPPCAKGSDSPLIPQSPDIVSWNILSPRTDTKRLSDESQYDFFVVVEDKMVMS